MDHREPSQSVVSVEFALADPSHPFVGVSAAESCRFELEEILPRSDGRYTEYFSVTGADPEAVEVRLSEYPQIEPHVIKRNDDTAFLEIDFDGDCPSTVLADYGALPRSVVAEDGDARIVAVIPPHLDATEVIGGFLEQFPEADLVAKRRRENFRPLLGGDELDHLLTEDLTEKQRSVLRTAFEAGYYDWPRETNCQGVADLLGLSAPTVSQHLRAAERKIVTALFEHAVDEEHAENRSD